MMIKNNILPLVLSLALFGCGRRAPQQLVPREAMVKVSNTYQVNLTNGFRISEFVSWNYSSEFERSESHVTLFRLDGVSKDVSLSLSQMRSSTDYLSEFNAVKREDYLEKAPWWIPHKWRGSEYIHLKGNGGIPEVLELHIIDNGTNVVVFGVETRRL